MCPLYQTAPCMKQSDTRGIVIYTLYQTVLYIRCHIFITLKFHNFRTIKPPLVLDGTIDIKMDQKIKRLLYQAKSAPCIRQAKTWCTLYQTDFYS